VSEYGLSQVVVIDTGKLRIFGFENSIRSNKWNMNIIYDENLFEAVLG